MRAGGVTMNRTFAAIAMLMIVAAVGCKTTGTAGLGSGGVEFLEAFEAETWGDPSTNCQGEWTAADTGGEYTCFAGGGWGCGVTFTKESGLADASGAARVVVSLKAGDGSRFHLYFSEDGVAAPDSGSFDGERGADGEQYATVELIGTGSRRDHSFEISDLVKAQVWGNQAGNERFDTQALKQVGVYVLPEQGRVEVEVYSIKFE